MSGAPSDEGARMAAVERYAILDTPPDGAFDRITALAARLFEVPVAIVSVVDHDRIWFKSHHGVDVEEIGRDPGLCASAILQEAPWVITDAPNDPRALANPLVAGEFGLKFYAGAPLRTGDGHNLGTMCILGFEPRVLTEAETLNLSDLASLVMSELELRLASLSAVAELQERMATEAAMQQRLRAAERMEGLAALAAGVAHDFNNLLTIILGNAGLISMEMPPGPLQERARVVLSSAQHAREVASQLLAFSRGQLLRPKETTLADMVDDLEVTIRDTVGSSVEVKRRTDGHQPTVLVDAEQMRRVVVNLVMNAVEAMPRGGAVTITTDSVTFSERGAAACHDSVAAGRYARLTVSDVGDGVDPSLLGRIFEPYFTTKADRSGTGLGLPTAYGIVRQSAGHLWLESTLGVGTEAHLILPSAMETERGRVSDDEAPAPVSTILVVEDNDPLRDLVTTVLARRGYHVLSASNAGEGLAVAAAYRERIDLVLSDVIMPGGSGPRLAEQLVRDRGHMRIMFMSGYADTTLINQLNVDTTLLAKPFTVEELVNAVESALEARPAARSDVHGAAPNSDA